MAGEEINNKIDQLARDVLRLARNTLLVNLRFLDAALSQFTLEPGGDSLATDGEHIFYDPRHVLRRYQAEAEGPVRDYLHMVMHCVFRHNFVSPTMEPDYWDLACDIAVENIINELALPSTAAKRQGAQQTALTKLTKAAGGATAEKLYHYLREEASSPAELEALAQLFRADDHALWYAWNAQAADGEGDGEDDGEGSGTGSQEQQSGQDGSGEQGQQEQDGGAGDNGGGQERQDSQGGTSRAELEQTWKDISERMQMDMETFSKERGDTAGNLMQNLREVNREKYDYTAFLKKFAVMGEAMKINDEEFDYIFYTYGLKLYEKMPLIEPLEYKDVKRIKEFVIAIDTSGSVQGELVQKFIQKTYNILKQEESFFSKINLHIIQCDTRIQEDAKITTQEEFDEYLKTMTLRGFGGTDFRPVFGYVSKLLEKKEFANLKGLIYFTDGCGVFPEQKPPYQTAFVFIDDAYNDYDVPPWAIKLILRPDEI